MSATSGGPGFSHSYPPQGPPPPHYQRQISGGPHAQPHYGMNHSPQTPSRAPGPPVQGGAFNQAPPSRSNYYSHPQSVMISPGGNGYVNGRSDYRGHPNSNYPGPQGAAQPSNNNWGQSDHDRYPPYNVGNGNNAVNGNMGGYSQHHQTSHPPPSGPHQEYNGGYSNPRHAGDAESNHHHRNGSGGPYNNERNPPGGHNNSQFSGNGSAGNYSSVYSQVGENNHQRHNGPTSMHQTYNGVDGPQSHIPNRSASRQSHHANGTVHNTSSTPADHELTRAVSSSFGDSVKSKSSDKENGVKNGSASRKGQLKNTKKGSPYQQSAAKYKKRNESVDDSSIASRAESDKSWRQLNQVASVEEDKFHKSKEILRATTVSNTSSITNSISSNTSNKKSKLKKESSDCKLNALNDLSSVASIQEPIDTSNSKDDDSVKNLDFAGAPDLMNCASSSGSLLFHPQDESLTKRPREGRGDTETGQREGCEEEIRGVPSTSPPNVADLSMKEKDKYRPNKKRRNSGEKDGRNSSNGYYDKPPSYTFSIESVPSFPKDVNKTNFPPIPPRPGSTSSSSLTPLGPLAQSDKPTGGQGNRDGNDGNIPSSMPSWEITGQDSLGGTLTFESAGSERGGGGPLLTSFSFNNEFQNNTNGAPQGNSSSQSNQYPNGPSTAVQENKQISGSSHQNFNQVPPHQYYSGSNQHANSGTSAPAIESRDPSFDGVRNTSFDGNYHNRGPVGSNRSEGIDMKYGGGSHHYDSYTKQRQQSSATASHRPRSPVQGSFPPHAPTWGGGSSTHGGQPQNTHSYNREQPEQVQHPVPPHLPGPVGPTSHHPNHPHAPYHLNHSGSFGAPTSSSQGGVPSVPHHRGTYDGNPMIRNFSQDSERSYQVVRTPSFGGPPPHHHHSDHHLPHAFRPPPPEFTGHPHLGRRPPPTVYIVSSPPGGRGLHGGHPHDPRLIGKGPGGVYSWSKEDDMRLTDIMKKYKNPRDWEPIAKEFGRGKTSKECHERWIRYLKPGVRKGQWQDHEDAIVVEAVTTSTEQPFTRWSDLAQRLPGRVGKQIRDRWVNHLNPNINHMPFSREDDLRLWEGHKKLGKRWVEISTKYFNSSRSENHIKNRWYSASFKKFIANEFGPDAYSGGEKKVKDDVKSPSKTKIETVPKKEDTT